MRERKIEARLVRQHSACRRKRSGRNGQLRGPRCRTGDRARRMRARCDRPRGRPAAEKANELTSPHIRTQARGTALYRLKRVLR